MSYSDFTMTTVQSVLGLTVQQTDLFRDVPPVEVTPWLRDTLALTTRQSRVNERSRSEFIVLPILLASCDLSENRISLYPGELLNVDRERGLLGECDYILALNPPLPFLRAPVGVVLEAKGGVIEAGLGQCAAQVVGAQLFDQRQGRNVSPVFGCVTSADDWKFLRLAETTLTIDRDYYYLNEVGKLLGIFQALIAVCRPGTAAA